MKQNSQVAQNPLLLRFHRLMDSFAKSDDERDFYLDRIEGFILYVDLDKPMQEVQELEKELLEHASRYALIPKMTFYETKKFMEGFVHEKVYDIDTKEKLLDIIGSKEARENFLEFIYDHLPELEKWQLYYSERSRIRIIEWLRSEQFQFVFEEDLDLPRIVVEKVKKHLFDSKVPKEVAQAREALLNKSKTYYSNEALNPRPKRGRPPKQTAKVEVEPQFTIDLYATVVPIARSFLYLPDISASSVTFSAKFDTEQQLLATLKGATRGVKIDTKLEALSQRLESLRHLSQRLGSIHESGGSATDDRLIKALNVPKSKEDKEEKEGGGFHTFIQGFLPKKRKERGALEVDSTPPTKKVVTSLSNKPKKKR